MAVVLHHAGIAAEDFAGGSFPGDGILKLGYLGVDFFFVLSGFIIYHSTVGRNRSFSAFASARLRRVFLPYLPVGIFYGLLYTFAPQLSAGLRNWSWLSTLTLLPSGREPALSVAWTLQHELVFYALFALLFFRGWLWPGMLLWGAIIVMASSTAIPLAMINLEFLMGMLAAVAFRKGWTSTALLVPSMLAFACWALMGAERNESVVVGAGIALLIPVLAGWERHGRVQVGRIWQFMGEASYSLYLVHLVAISIVARLFDTWYLVLTSAVTASLVAGIGYHLVVERRLLEFRFPPLPPRSQSRLLRTNDDSR